MKKDAIAASAWLDSGHTDWRSRVASGHTVSSFRQIPSPPPVTFCYSLPRFVVNDVTAVDYSSCHLDGTHRHDRRPVPSPGCRRRLVRLAGLAYVVTYGNAKRREIGVRGGEGSGTGRAAISFEASVTCNAIVGGQCPVSN